MHKGFIGEGSTLAKPVSMDELWRQIDASFDEVVELCTDLIKCPTENPSGDTSSAVEFLSRLFSRESIPFEVFEPLPGVKSICADWLGDSPGPTLVLNGHLDTFPADDAALWSCSPFGGEVKDGRIYGRGAADMKGGVTASLFTFLLFHRVRPRARGRLRLMLVADEETGGKWGTDWIIAHKPEMAGDACLIGEPTGLGALRIGEKGQVWLRLRATGVSYHAGVADGSGPVSEIADAVRVLRDELVGMPGTVPDDVRGAVESTKGYPWFDQYRGREWVVDHVSLNFGLIRGGIKINIVPRLCELDVDIRLPTGVEPGFIVDKVREALEGRGLRLEIEPMLDRFCPANYTSPAHPLVSMLKSVATAVVGKEPILMFSPTFTDARLFRIRGVPAVLFGPSPHNMAGPDEFITVSDLMAVTRVHAGLAWKYLVGSDAA